MHPFLNLALELRRGVANERGVSMFATAMWITALFAMVAVGVDVARIGFTAAEVQTLAEVAATSAATTVNNGGTAGQSQTDADTVVALNAVNGAASGSVPVEIGTVDANGNYSAGGALPNAAKATATTTVTNLFSAVINSQNTTVRKVAYATLATISVAKPNFPMAVNLGCFNNGNCTADPSTCPSLTTGPGSPTNSGCWTGYTSGHSDSTVLNYLPTNGDSRCHGGSALPGVITTSDNADVTNGVASNVWQAAQCAWCANKDAEYIVAVVDNGACGTADCSHPYPVVGFATVKIAYFLDVSGAQITASGGCGGSPKGMVLQSFRNTDVPGGVGGCAKCGTGFVRLFQPASG